jgi:exopolyphosphatase
MSSPYSDIRAYLQGNTLASRKKVLPIIKDFLRDRERREVHCGTLEESYEVPQQRAYTEDAGIEDSYFPPTPMNSLVEGCPLDNGLPKISAEALTEKFSKMASEEENAGGL